MASGGASSPNGNKPRLAVELPSLIGLCAAYLYEAGWIHNYEYVRLFGLPVQIADAGLYATLVNAITVLESIGDYWQPPTVLALAALVLLAVHTGRAMLGLIPAAALFAVIPSWSQTAARQTVEEVVRDDGLPTIVFVLRDEQQLISEAFVSANARESLRLLRQETDAFHVFERRTNQGPDQVAGIGTVFVVPRSGVNLVEIYPRGPR